MVGLNIPPAVPVNIPLIFKNRDKPFFGYADFLGGVPEIGEMVPVYKRFVIADLVGIGGGLLFQPLNLGVFDCLNLSVRPFYKFRKLGMFQGRC
jgi:hypothetical protein